MYAIEFTARIRDGAIQVPEEYQGKLTDTVRVILMLEEGAQESPDIIDALLEHPLQAPAFIPLSREEAHAGI
jgi:ureidoglycolate hydrolase